MRRDPIYLLEERTNLPRWVWWVLFCGGVIAMGGIVGALYALFWAPVR